MAKLERILGQRERRGQEFQRGIRRAGGVECCEIAEAKWVDRCRDRTGGRLGAGVRAEMGQQQQ